MKQTPIGTGESVPPCQNADTKPSLEILYRPKDMPPKADEPMDAEFLIVTRKGIIPLESPNIEVQFLDSIIRPAFPLVLSLLTHFGLVLDIF